MDSKNLLHIKLDKLIYGENQHIFKTSVSKFIKPEDEISGIININDYLSSTINTVMYSNYIPQSQSNEYQLLDFDEIKFLYKNNIKSFSDLKQFLNGTSQFYKNYFYKYLNPDENTQQIFYFNYLDTPIDVINIENTGYFLSELQNKKNIQLVQQKQLLNGKYIQSKATNKHNYQQAMNYLTDRTVNYSEANTIPIYDLQFNFIDTINLSSYQNLTQWIEKYSLSEISSTITYINENDNYYSINLHKLLTELTDNIDYSYKFSNDNLIELLCDLFAYIPYSSINKYVDKYGTISKLNKKFVNKVRNNYILSTCFNNLSQTEIKEIFSEKYKDSFFVNEIPRNTLYMSNLNNKLQTPSINYEKISAYYNFINLKNNFSPQNTYNIEFPSSLYDIINYFPDEQYVTLNNENRMETILLDPNFKYIVKYYDNEFYFNVGNRKVYSNDLLFMFMPCGILQSSTCTKKDTPKYPDDYPSARFKDVTSTVYEKNSHASASIPFQLSSTIWQAAYEKKSYIQPDRIGQPNEFQNKARGISWNIPPYYKYNVNLFLNENAEKFYVSKDTFVDHKLYYPSGITKVYFKNQKRQLLENDFPNMDQEDSHYQRPPMSECLKVSATISSTFKNNELVFEFNTPDVIYGSCIFKITKILENYQDINKYIYNLSRMVLFDVDKNKSLAFQQNNLTTSELDKKTYLNPIKKVVSSLLQYGSLCDNYIAQNNEQYEKNYSERLSGKIDNYLNQFNEFHIENNRYAQTGDLNGIRIYEKLGKNNNESIWTSYKYITMKNNNFENMLLNTYTLPFKINNLNRFSQNMEINEIGNIKYKGVDDIKSMVGDAINTQYGFFDTTINSYLCSSCFNCKIPSGTKCNCGYCTFPYDNKAKLLIYNSSYPNNVYYTKNLDSNFYLLNINQTYQQKIKTKTQINVNDDIEIYFVPNTISTSELSTLFSNQEFIKYSFYSIFQGFGGTNQNNNIEHQIKYKDYLMVNNPNNQYQKTYNIITLKQQLSALCQYIPESDQTSNKTFNDLFKTVKLKYILNGFHNLNKDKEEIFIDNEDNEYKELSDEENNLINSYINDLLEQSNEFKFLLNEKISLYNLYATNDIIVSQTDNLANPNNYTYRQISLTNLYDILLTSTTASALFNFKNKKSLQNEYILNNGFVISKYSPFNGPHTIKSDTQLYGLILSGNNTTNILSNLKNKIETTNIIPENYNIVLRVVNWWDDIIKCTGKISVYPTQQAINNDNTLSATTNIVNNYDFADILNNDFALKYSQSEYKKSNIYSIKIKNSGLNPKIELFQDTKKCLILRDYISLSNSYKKLYNHITWNQLQSTFEAYYTSGTVSNYYQDLLYIQENTTVEFFKYNTLSEKSDALSSYYKQIDGYYKLNEDKIEEIKQIKTDLRNNLENAVKNSIGRYMPIDTKLWKIIYEGK